MSKYGLLHISTKVEAGDRDSLLEALRCLSDSDCDFNGENGLEYLRSEVWEANGFEDEDAYEEACEEPDSDSEEWESWEEPKLKFESNQDYYLNEVKDIESDEECISDFLNSWLDNDGYYNEWKYEILKDNNGKVIGISIAALTYC